jgi:hypothetical protein
MMINIILGMYAFQVLMVILLLLSPGYDTDTMYESKRAFLISFIPFYWVWQLIEYWVEQYNQLK